MSRSTKPVLHTKDYLRDAFLQKLLEYCILESCTKRPSESRKSFGNGNQKKIEKADCENNLQFYISACGNISVNRFFGKFIKIY